MLRTGGLSVDNDEAVIHRARLCPQVHRPATQIICKSSKTPRYYSPRAKFLAPVGGASPDISCVTYTGHLYMLLTVAFALIRLRPEPTPLLPVNVPVQSSRAGPFGSVP